MIEKSEIVFDTKCSGEKVASHVTHSRDYVNKSPREYPVLLFQHLLHGDLVSNIMLKYATTTIFLKVGGI